MNEALSDGQSDALNVSETVVRRKSKLSEDEIRLGEEALRNALIEIEALGKTAAYVANELAEKKRPVRSENEVVPRNQEQLEGANSWRLAGQEHSKEEQTLVPGKETHQRAAGECEIGKEEAHPDGYDSTQRPGSDVHRSETDFTFVPNQTPCPESELQHEDLGAVPGPLSETGIALWDHDSDIPAEVIRRLQSDSANERAGGLSDLSRLGGETAFRLIALAFDEQSEEVRNAAAMALFDLQADRAASFARTLRESLPERRQRIGAALTTSGLAGIAIGNLAGQSREKGYEAFSLLFLMTKAGEVQPLLRAVEDHPNIEVRLTVVKLLALSGQAELVPSLRRLAVCGILPSEVRAAVIDAVYELGRQVPRQVSSVAKG